MTRARRTAVLVAAALVLAGCAAAPDEGGTTAGAPCAAPVMPQRQEASHLLGDTAPPVPYSSVPPSSGWHASGAPPAPGVYGTQLSDPQLVLWLESGGVYVAHDPSLDADAAAVLVEAAEADPRLLVTPYADADLPGPVVLVGWGVLQACDTADADAITAFTRAHGGPGSAH